MGEGDMFDRAGGGSTSIVEMVVSPKSWVHQCPYEKVLPLIGHLPLRNLGTWHTGVADVLSIHMVSNAVMTASIDHASQWVAQGVHSQAQML
ncbi:hypothetical protein PanWU01x14_187550 [Parasponia andersonii]|uniref:Uncharacterized protein n=1 Tax=Parasponia andersonii TaxID=3476 RepID=A0A2P5C3H7_PARAD|nr:hypothetical protein PanWU01x14_187550 [Parasponia andersonii]